MWPLWAYILCGIASAVGFAGCITLGIWLYEQYEELFGALLVAIFFIAVGALLGYMKYEDNLKKAQQKAQQPRPPAEAPVQ